MQSYRLFRSVGSAWPAGLNPPEDSPSSAEELVKLGHEHGVLYVLGYASPLECLLESIERAQPANPSNELDCWRDCCEAMLQIKLHYADNCRLVNLSELGQSGFRALASELNVELPASQSYAQRSPIGLASTDSLLIMALAERLDLYDLYADLEMNADLYGREPMVNIGLPAFNPRERSEAMISACRLHNTLKVRQAQTSIECDNLRQDNRRLQEQLDEADEERQLLLLQLQQLQEELIAIYADLQSTRGLQKTAEELASDQAGYIEKLRIECSYLLGKSQAHKDLDRQRIPLLLQELRSNLYA